MRIASIIVTFNRSKLLIENIESMLKMDGDFDIFVIDNASTDDTNEVLKDYIDNNKIKYVRLDNNIGGAGGFNFGIKYVTKLGYDYAYLVDDDVICNKDSLQKLVDYINTNKEKNIGFLSSKVLWKDDKLCNMNIPKRTMMKKIKDTSDIQRIQYATFVSILINIKAVKKLGLPIKEFFIWTDDFEYTRRISKCFECFYIPSSVVIHNCENNNGSNIVNTSVDRLDRFKYKYRNEQYVYKREGIKGRIYQFLKVWYHILKVIIKSKEMKKEKIKIIINSNKEGKHFNPKIEMVEINEKA